MFGAFARAYILLSVKSAGAEIRSTIGSPHSGACALHSPALSSSASRAAWSAGEWSAQAPECGGSGDRESSLRNSTPRLAALHSSAPGRASALHSSAPPGRAPRTAESRLDPPALPSPLLRLPPLRAARAGGREPGVRTPAGPPQTGSPLPGPRRTRGPRARGGPRHYGDPHGTAGRLGPRGTDSTPRHPGVRGPRTPA